MSVNRGGLHLDRRGFLQWSALVGFGAASGMLWGCSGSPAAKPSPGVVGPQGDLVIIQGVDIESLDPHVTTSGASKAIMWAMYDKLVDRDPSMKVIPNLAVSWSVLSDTKWEFKLRDNVFFHNGEKFGANHVKASIARFVDPSIKNVYGSLLKPATEVKVVDDLTVHITTDGPYALLLEVLSLYCEILPLELIEGKADITRTAIGTGPYKFVEWMPNEKVAMIAADKPHHTGQPKAKRITWRPVPEAATRVVELKSGTAHLITPLSPINAEELKSDPNVTVVEVRQQSTNIIVFNCERSYFKDKRVRQALNMAVDVEGIIKSVNRGAGFRANGPFGPGVPGYDPNLKPYPYDPERAKKLLEEAGLGSGFELTLASPNGRYLNDKLVSEAIAGQWAKVGVKAKVEAMEWGAFVQALLAKKLDAFFFLQGGVLTDSTASINFHSGKKGGPWQGYRNEEVDKIIDEAPKMLEPAVREKLYQRLSTLINEDAPWLFLYNPKLLFALHKSAKGWEPHLDGTIRLGNLTT